MLKAHYYGEPYAMGLMHGKKYAAEIKSSMMAHVTEQTRKACLEALGAIQATLFDKIPEALDEMRGIADGAGLAMEDILTLCYWEDVAALHAEPVKGLCTSIGFVSTVNEGPIMGKTSDIEEHQRNDYVLCWQYPDIGNKMLYLGKVGTLKIEAGMNDKGLVIGSSSAQPKDKRKNGIERMLLLRYLLQTCASVAEAEAFLANHDFFFLGLNIMLMDKTGKTAVVERASSHQSSRPPAQNNVIYATNFYVCDSMRPHYDDSAWYLKNAADRYSMLEKVFSDVKMLNSALLRETLSSHHTMGSICNHEKDLDSFYASVMYARKGIYEITDGRPCETPFITYNLYVPETHE